MKRTLSGILSLFGAFGIGFLVFRIFEPSSSWTVFWLVAFPILGFFAGIADVESKGSGNARAAGAGGAASPSNKGFIGVTSVENAISELLLIRAPPGTRLRVAIIRQSGNEDRYLVTNSQLEVMDIIRSTFRRKKVDEVRVWKNTAKVADVRINYYHGRGTREGRVIAGVRVTRA